MKNWEWILFGIAALVAVRSLTKLMHAQAAQLVETLSNQMDHELQQRQLATKKQKEIARFQKTRERFEKQQGSSPKGSQKA